jgi:hypothetical protein
MISHGEEMLRDQVGDRQYAERLEKFGRARCKIAVVRMTRLWTFYIGTHALLQAQEEYASRVGEGYVAGMESALAVVQEYQAIRKKLDSRRYVPLHISISAIQLMLTCRRCIYFQTCTRRRHEKDEFEQEGF